MDGIKVVDSEPLQPFYVRPDYFVVPHLQVVRGMLFAAEQIFNLFLVDFKIGDLNGKRFRGSCQVFNPDEDVFAQPRDNLFQRRRRDGGKEEEKGTSAYARVHRRQYRDMDANVTTGHGDGMIFLQKNGRVGC